MRRAPGASVISKKRIHKGLPNQIIHVSLRLVANIYNHTRQDLWVMRNYKNSIKIGPCDTQKYKNSLMKIGKKIQHSENICRKIVLYSILFH